MTFSLPLAADGSTDALSAFATALKVPVRIAAVILLVILAYEVGRLLVEGWRRVRPGARGLQTVTLDALDRPGEAARIARGAPGPLAEAAVLALAGAASAQREDAFETALATYELHVQRRLDRTRMLVRAGPAVGLMGTLIPLAPGLSSLGKGDYATLANDLKVAFAATVAGLLVGTVAFGLTLVRTRVYTEDLAALEHAVARHEPQLPHHHRVEAHVGEHQA